MRNFLIIWLSCVLLLTSCSDRSLTTVSPNVPTQPLVLATSPITPTASATHSPTVTAYPTTTPEPIGCLKPPDDYTHIDVNGWTINQRTLAMLAHARKLYSGKLEI